MKKIIAMLLALVMVFALCACGQSAAPPLLTPRLPPMPPPQLMTLLPTLHLLLPILSRSASSSCMTRTPLMTSTS